MRQMDYGLLMRRVMAQVTLLGHGAVCSTETVTAAGSNDSRILSEPGLVYASNCWKCQRTTNGRRLCQHCGVAAEVVYVSAYWLQDQWHRAFSTERKAALIRMALDMLRLARVRKRAKHDVTTQDGRLALGMDLVSGTDVRVVAKEYGFSTKYAYSLKKAAERELERQVEERELRRYAGTLEDRVRIAAMPGSSYSVAAQFENVSAQSVKNWRRTLDRKVGEEA